MNNLFSFESIKIASIKNKQQVILYAKIENVSLQKTVTGSEFLNVTLIDDTGMINAKKWNVYEQDKSFKAGQVVFITGNGSEYNGKVQLIIEQIRLIDETDQVDLSIFYPKAPLEIETLKKKLFTYLSAIQNVHIRSITDKLVKKYEEKFFIFPAASKNHHAYISGLAHHVCTMLDLAKAYATIYPNINLDLLYSGVILHDIGKVIELSDHLAPEYTTVGKLIGHINIAFEEIRMTANELNIQGEEVTLIQHLVLSHHGLLEYGSPKTPMILEAELLHMIDLLDSRMNMITEELNQVSEQEFTKKIYSLDGRAFYKHNV